MKHVMVGVLFFITTSVISQAPGRFELGIYSGVELNFVSSSSKSIVSAYRSLPAFNIGFRLQHHFSTKYSIVGGMEFSYLQFAYRQPDPQMGSFPVMLVEGPLKYDMFRMPILFQMNFGEKKSKFFFNVGPTVMFCDIKNGGMYTTTFGSSPEVINHFNMGGNASIGYSYAPVPWFKLYIETSFLVPLFATPYNGYYDPSTLRVLTAGGKLGISFRLHRPKFMEAPQSVF